VPPLCFFVSFAFHADVVTYYFLHIYVRRRRLSRRQFLPLLLLLFCACRVRTCAAKMAMLDAFSL